MDFNNSALAEVVTVPLTPFLVSLGKSNKAHIPHTVHMPKSRGKIHPFLAAILADRAVKQIVDSGIGLVQKGDEVVLHHRLGFGV